MYEGEDLSGLPFWEVSCATKFHGDNSDGILAIIYVSTRFINRLFSRNIGQLSSVAQKIAVLESGKSFRSICQASVGITLSLESTLGTRL